MRSWVVKTGFLMVVAALLGGCGQSSAPKPNPNAVFQVTVIPASLSLVAGEAGPIWARALGFVALVFASINIFGGFLVTQRMLSMYTKKKK